MNILVFYPIKLKYQVTTSSCSGRIALHWTAREVSSILSLARSEHGSDVQDRDLNVDTADDVGEISSFSGRNDEGDYDGSGDAGRKVCVWRDEALFRTNFF